MTNAELDGWGYLLVGHQWPSSASVSSLSTAAANRGTIESAFENYAEVLQSICSGPLAEQRGVTADDTVDAFQQGKDNALEVSEKNGEKRTAYDGAIRVTNALRDDL